MGDEARAIVRQHLVRMALRPDGKGHHVETWATLREIWRRTPQGCGGCGASTVSAISDGWWTG